jgi:hypothetical protein
MERKHHLRHSDAVSLLSANPYFAVDLAQLKGQLWSARYLTVKIYTMQRKCIIDNLLARQFRFDKYINIAQAIDWGIDEGRIRRL